MLRGVVLGALLAGACASPQRLSKTIYDHEQRAWALAARGECAAAAEEQRHVVEARERLAHKEHLRVVMHVPP